MPPLMGLLCGIMHNKPHSQAGIHRRTVSTAMADVLTQTHEYMNMPCQAEQHEQTAGKQPQHNSCCVHSPARNGAQNFVHTPMPWHMPGYVHKGFEDPSHCRTMNSRRCVRLHASDARLLPQRLGTTPDRCCEQSALWAAVCSGCSLHRRCSRNF